MKNIESIKSFTPKVAKGILVVFTIKLLLFGILFIVQSCQTDNINNYEVITDKNLKSLKIISLEKYNNVNIDFLVNPRKTKLDFQTILNELKKTNTNEKNLNDFYNTEFYNQLVNLFEITQEIFNSNMFEPNSTIDERKPYVEIIIKGLVEKEIVENYNLSFKSSCANQTGYDSCESHALNNHRNRIALATVLGAAASILTVSPFGLMGTVVTVVASGVTYDSDIAWCDSTFCDNQNQN